MDRHTRTLIVSATEPGFMRTVMRLALLICGGWLLSVHKPAPGPTVHLNCTPLPTRKLFPSMISVSSTPAATDVGLTLLTVGTAVVVNTVTDCANEEQSDAFVWLDDRHTRTRIVSSTVPGFMLIVIEVELLTDGGLLLVVHTPEPAPAPHLNCTRLTLWKLLPLIVRLCKAPSAVIDFGLTLVTEGTGVVAVTVTD